MTHRTIPVASVSADPGVLRTLRDTLDDTAGYEAVLEITQRFSDITPEQAESLRSSRAEILFLDMGEDPSTAIRFAQYLVEGRPGLRIVAAGHELTNTHLVEAMRAGVTEYLPKPVAGSALRDALHRIRRRTPEAGPAEPLREGEICAVVGAKGGAGATTLAMNLAVMLRQRTEKRVVLVDLDTVLGEIALYLGLEPRFNLGDLAKNLHRMDEGLLSTYLETHDSGIQVLPAPLSPEAGRDIPPEAVRKCLKFLKNHFDHVVVDLSRSFSPLMQAAIGEAGKVFLVTQPDMPSLRNIKRGLPLLDRVLGPGDDRLHLVLNRAGPGALISQEEIERALGLKVSFTLANDYEAASRAVNTGEPLVLETRDSPLARDIRQICDRITGAEAPVAPGLGSWLRWRPRFFPGATEAVSHG